MPKSTLYKSKCEIEGKITVSSTYSQNDTDADLILFVGYSDDPDKNYNAYANFCLQHGSTGRPMVGYMIFNSAKIFISQQKIEFNLNITAHEFMHILGFNLRLFPSFPKNSKGEEVLYKDNNGKYYFKGDSLIEKAKEHFGCSAITMLPLEDEGVEGTLGNHFEATIFGNDIMVASAKTGYRVSIFSLALLKDSGWYEIDFSMAEKITWGKNRGCSFVGSSCYAPVPAKEFCSFKYLSCSSDTKSTTKCLSTFFSNSCKMRMIFESCASPASSLQIFETRSGESQCHEYKNQNGTTAACVKTECDYQGLKYYMVKDQGDYKFRFLCEYKNQEHIIPNFGFTLLCEDPKVMCTKKLECPKNCNGRGICMANGKCLCNMFYDGDLCGRFVGCKQEGLSICNQIYIAEQLNKDTLSNDYSSALTEFQNVQNILKGSVIYCFSNF